jgi:hypothetical protein
MHFVKKFLYIFLFISFICFTFFEKIKKNYHLINKEFFENILVSNGGAYINQKNELIDIIQLMEIHNVKDYKIIGYLETNININYRIKEIAWPRQYNDKSKNIFYFEEELSNENKCNTIYQKNKIILCII